MHDVVVNTEQLVPLPRHDVFAFFANPRNLEAITPTWLRFRIHEQTSPEIRKGTEFTYQLSVHGLPMTWRSRIDEWEPDVRFVDVQLKGPYDKWHHIHTFEDRGSDTLIRDRVLYRLPLGWLGNLLVGRFVASDVRKIFEFRAVKTSEMLFQANGVGRSR